MPPSPDPRARLLLETLSRHQVRYVVIGAVAAIAQGYPLTTRDVDVTPARDETNLELIVQALKELEAELRLPEGSLPFPIDARFLAGSSSWTLATRDGDLDLLFEPAGTTGYDDLLRDAVEIDLGEGLIVAMASLRDVIRMKEAAGRPKDLAQLPALRQTLEILRERQRRGEPT